MFTKSQTETKLDAEINSALEELESLDKTSDEYGKIIDRIAKLHKLKIDEAQTELKTHEVENKVQAESKRKLPSADTALVVAANLIGILWITRYERENVVNTKALGFIMKPR